MINYYSFKSSMLLKLQRFKFSFWFKSCFFCVKGTMISKESENDFNGHHQKLLFSMYWYQYIFEKIIKYIKVSKKNLIRNRNTLRGKETYIVTKRVTQLQYWCENRTLFKTLHRFLFGIFFLLYFKAKDKMLSCYKFVYWKQNLKEKDSVLKLKLKVGMTWRES